MLIGFSCFSYYFMAEKQESRILIWLILLNLVSNYEKNCIKLSVKMNSH